MATGGSGSGLLEVRDLVKHYAVRGGGEGVVVRAVDGVSFEVGRGETLGLVGESGCGKSTLGKTVLHLEEPTAGAVVFEGRELTGMSRSQWAEMRGRMQIVFQDPFSSLNPRKTVAQSLGLALRLAGARGWREMRERSVGLLEMVGLEAPHLQRYPHQLSGGQRQRVVIARALAMEPEFIVADEPVAALDVSVQAQIINLLEDLRRRLGLAMLLIAHDISVIALTCERTAVMYLGRIVEIGPTREVVERALHPYTEALMSAVPRIEEERQPPRAVLIGDVPSPVSPPSGCRFHTRCFLEKVEECVSVEPALEEKRGGHFAACHVRTG